MDEIFKKDSVAILSERFQKGEISRRDFLGLAAMLGLTTAGVGLSGNKALAAEEITIANYGGDAIQVYGDAWGKPFTEKTGVAVNIDGSGPLIGSIKKMVDDNNVIWDIADTDPSYGLQLGEKYFEPIDYSVVDPKGFFEFNKYPLSAGNYVYSHVIAYDKTKVPEEPKGWADFFDLKKFPGKRVMFKWFIGTGEAFMLAAGKKPEEVYPIDMKLVADMIAEMGDNLVLWDSGASSQQVFLDEEVVMGNIWNTRATVLERDTKGRVAFTWNQQILCPAAWSILKGRPDNVKSAQQFIASTQDPKSQIKMLDAMGNGPANPATLALLTDAQKRSNPTSHLDAGMLRNEQWYADHYDTELTTWLDAVSG